MRKRPFVKAAKPDKGGLLLGYARVSKGDEQTNTLQAILNKSSGDPCNASQGKVTNLSAASKERNIDDRTDLWPPLHGGNASCGETCTTRSFGRSKMR